MNVTQLELKESCVIIAECGNSAKVACLIRTNGNCPHLEQAIVCRNHAIMVQNVEKP
jgi:hypothetical protein